MRLRPFLALAPLLALAGCGNNLVYQSRYVPRPSQMGWDQEHLELPWQPPALDEVHYQRKGKPSQPQFAADIVYDVDTGPDGQLTEAAK